MISAADRNILRELARDVVDISKLPVMEAWIGGGPRWHVRYLLPWDTENEWRNIQDTFTTEAESTWLLIILSQDIADSIDIDDIRIMKAKINRGETERRLHRRDMTQLSVDTAEKFGHDAIFLRPNPADLDEIYRLIDEVRRISGSMYFLWRKEGVYPNERT